ncbi:MAG: amidohydrolase family protein [Anaerolineae bacterium]
MKRIDAHCHIFPPEVIAAREKLSLQESWFGELYRNPKHRLATAEELVSSMAQAGVDLAVVFGFAFNDPGLCHLCNQYVLEAVGNYPDQLLAFAVVQPKDTQAALHESEICLAEGALGLGEILPDGQGFTLDDWDTLDPLMAYLRSVDKPIMLHVNEQLGHTYPGKGKHGVSASYALSSRYRDNTLILSHWGGGLLFYELMPEVRKTLRNVYYDTAASAYLYDDRIYSNALSWMPDKILWGTDFPLLDQKRIIKHIEGLSLPQEPLENMFWRNTNRVLGLDRTAEGDNPA